MTTRTAKRLGRAVMGVAAATQLAACADNGPLGLDRTPAAGGTRAANPSRTADLTGCPQLEVPEGSKLAFHAYAAGVQIYRWNGAGWDFVAPSAVLYADADGQGVVGVHYGGPTWEGASGSRVSAPFSTDARRALTRFPGSALARRLRKGRACSAEWRSSSA